MTGYPSPPIDSALTGGLADLPLPARVARIRAAITGRIVFTTSFGLEDQAIAHAIFTAGLDIAVVTLDTGRLFPETYELWAETEKRYRQRIAGFVPDQQALQVLIGSQGINGFYASVANRKACCTVRKIEPLRRALAGAAAWITGVRAEQSDNRAAMGFVVHDEAHGLIKVNPLLDWPRDQLIAYIRTERIPYNALHDRGYPSIGCQPCTRAIRSGEPERAGRWWWERNAHKECGLHVAPDGRLQPAYPGHAVGTG